MWVSRSRAGARTDGREAVAADDSGMSYAILWRENGSRVRAGKLVLHCDCLVIEGADGRVAVRRQLTYVSLRSIRIDRGRDERLDGRPVAIMQTGPSTFKIASLAGRGELNEIVARIGGALTGAQASLA